MNSGHGVNSIEKQKTDLLNKIAKQLQDIEKLDHEIDEKSSTIKRLVDKNKNLDDQLEEVKKQYDRQYMQYQTEKRKRQGNIIEPLKKQDDEEERLNLNRKIDEKIKFYLEHYIHPIRQKIGSEV